MKNGVGELLFVVTNTLSGERVNLTTYPPICLPSEKTVDSLDQEFGHIFGEFVNKHFFILFESID